MVSVLQPIALPTGVPVSRLVDGSKTSTIYALIRDGSYQQAIIHLTSELTSHPNSRAALSLLGHCYYQLGDYQSAAQCYQQLIEIYPDYHDYHLYYSLSLYKAALYQEALNVITSAPPPPIPQSSTSTASSNTTQHIQLQSYIHYDLNDLTTSASFLATLHDSIDVCMVSACILYKQQKYEACLTHVNATLAAYGQNHMDLLYLSALCHYQLHNYTAAMKLIHTIIETGVANHPEFSVGAVTDGLAVSSVGNSKILHDSQLIEAFNLKFAIDYTLKNMSEVRNDLTDMPYRLDNELDIITLHNQALYYMDEQPGENLKKLNFILMNYATSPHNFPREAFHNLLIFYIKFELYDLCADILAENPHLIQYLSTETYHFLSCVLLIPTNPAEAYHKLEQLSQTYREQLKNITKKIQDARIVQNSTEVIRTLLLQYDQVTLYFLPVIMYMCKIYWDREYYEMVEQILLQSGNVEFLQELELFQINLGHCYFMQDTGAGGSAGTAAGTASAAGTSNKYKEAMKYYKNIIMKHYGETLAITPVILANLCVSYIMCSENEEAEELMRLIEKEEETKIHEQQELLTQHLANNKSTAAGATTNIHSNKNPLLTKQYYHLCIVNLVIGTLYCSKNNFEFGMSRVIKSFDGSNFGAKLNADTWFYVKKNILTVCEYTAKNMLVLKEELYRDMMSFLTECEKYGKNIKSSYGANAANAVDGEAEKNNIAYEARLLQRMLMKLKDQ